MSQNAYDYSFELKKARQIKITRSILVIVGVFLFISLFLSFVLFPVHIKSDSMEGTLEKGGAVFVSPLPVNYSRGEIVFLEPMDNKGRSFSKKIAGTFVKFFTFQKMDLFLSPERMTGNYTIRRVAAVPGDTFYMKDYVLYVKPKGQEFFLTEFELAARNYDVHIYSVPVEWDGMGPSSFYPETTLGEGEYFVLDDNRIESIDSRLYGIIPGSRIAGRVLMQYFPLNKIKFF